MRLASPSSMLASLMEADMKVRVQGSWRKWLLYSCNVEMNYISEKTEWGLEHENERL